MINLFDKNAVKILTIFSLSPGSRFNRRILQEKTKINNIVLDKSINRLLNLKIIIKEKNLLYLNFKNKEIRKVLELMSRNYNKLKQLPLVDYFMILDIFEDIIKIKFMGDLYLFGSYSKLTFKKDSDIDFAIISDNVNKKDINKTIQKLEKRFKKDIEIHFFTRGFYNNKRDPLVKEIIQNGVKLN